MSEQKKEKPKLSEYKRAGLYALFVVIKNLENCQNRIKSAESCMASEAVSLAEKSPLKADADQDTIDAYNKDLADYNRYKAEKHAYDCMEIQATDMVRLIKQKFDVHEYMEEYKEIRL